MASQGARSMSFHVVSSLFKYVLVILIYLFVYRVVRVVFLDISEVGTRTSLLPSRHAYLIKMNCGRNLQTNFFYPLVKKRIVLGRAESCDIKVADIYVSAEHLCLSRDGGRWTAEDIGSQNGTFVNGIKISQPYLLDDRDVLKVGDTEFQFCLNR